MSEFLIISPSAERLKDTTNLNEFIGNLLSTTFSNFENYSIGHSSMNNTLHALASKYGTFAMSRGREVPSQVSTGDYWTVASDFHSAQGVNSAVRLIGGQLAYQKPIWGTYCAAFGDRYMNRIFAWNTTPALEPIHYATKYGFNFVSNRPLLIALALSEISDTRLSLSYPYFLEYLNYGYSLEGNTPFADVLTLPVDRALKIIDGEIALTDFPHGLVPDFSVEHTTVEGGEALADALTDSTADAVTQLEDRRLQLRLSGGKDSRMLLGALKNTEAEVRAVTYGTNSDLETHLSAKLASITGIRHDIGRPSFEIGDTAAVRTANVIKRCLGIPPSEAHLSQYLGAAPEFFGEAIALGQWPLWKGGMAKLLRNTPEYTTLMLEKQSSGILRSALSEQHGEFLTSWRKNVSASSELEKLYLFAREFRSGRYMQSHINHYAQDAKIVYPISDMRVTAICDRLSMAEKVSEKALFVALRKIWPESLNLSFHGSSWRFESGGANAELSGDSYDQRIQPVELPSASKVAPDLDGVEGEGEELSKPFITSLCQQLIELDNWPFVASHLDSKFILNVDLVASGEEQTYSTVHREFAKYVWRTFTASVWFSGSWIYNA